MVERECVRGGGQAQGRGPAVAGLHRCEATKGRWGRPEEGRRRRTEGDAPMHTLRCIPELVENSFACLWSEARDFQGITPEVQGSGKPGMERHCRGRHAPRGGAAGGEEDDGITADLDVVLDGSELLSREGSGGEGVNRHLLELAQVNLKALERHVCTRNSH